MKSSADQTPSSETAIEAAAAAWLSLRDHGMSPDETAAFLRWLQQDSRHAEIFAELDRVWARLDRLAALSPATPPGVRSDADLLKPRPRLPRRRVAQWIALGAAAAAMIAGAYYLPRALPNPERTVQTEVGAFRKIDLPDGSMAQLNTDSAIQFTFTATERRVHVIRGEVFFTVAKDPARPFLVAAGPVVVRAVGTAFNVCRRASGVEVLVTEGRVALAQDNEEENTPAAKPVHYLLSELSAGQRALVTPPTRDSTAPSMTVERVTEPALQRALAWQERRLEFDSNELADVIREFNRYNRDQLVITDPVLAGRRFSGVFRADSYESFVRLLETDFGVSAERRGHEIFLRSSR